MSTSLYRTESAYGSGVRDIIQVIFWEVTECCNMDILDYTVKNHRECLSEHTLKNLTMILNNDTILELAVLEIIKDVIKEINKYYGLNLKYCLWLTSREAVINLYNGDESSIDEYEISDIILSDLGYDGKLFAYEKFPEPIKHL